MRVTRERYKKVPSRSRLLTPSVVLNLSLADETPTKQCKTVVWAPMHAAVTLLSLPLRLNSPLAMVLSPPTILIRQAESEFVEPGENLELGEVLVEALKAFDDEGSLLCAGALVQRQSACGTAVHDCWLADSMTCGVGPNIQLAGAQHILDNLFLLHLRSGKLTFNVIAENGEGTLSGAPTAASHYAAQSRGFTSEVLCVDSDMALLRFNATVGLACYRQLARGALAGSSTSRSIVRLLEQRDWRQRRLQGRRQQQRLQQQRRQQQRPRRQQPAAVKRRRSGIRATMSISAVRRAMADLRSDDWQPLTPEHGRPWSNPCFISSFLTLGSIVAAARRELFVPFGMGPLLVLASSLIYWADPVKESVRRTVDLLIVRAGLAWQVWLAWRCCSPASVALPRLLAGYACGMACYAGGRILTVRHQLWAGALVHCGVHVFANLGNLLILPLAT